MKLEWVQETPDQVDNRTRRPRMVNACDYCRRKKTRCIRKSGQANCDICTQAGGLCTFEDRTKYQIDRERRHASFVAPDAAIVADMQPGQSTYATVGSGGSLITSFRFNPSDEDIYGMPASSSSANNLCEYMSGQVPAPPMQTLTTSNMAGLFDPSQPTQPHPALLPCLVKVYYEHIHPSIPIISSECIVSQYLTSILNPALANALAALASPYAAIMPKFAGQDLVKISGEYLNMSKRALKTNMSAPTRQDLVALVLVAWIERQSGHLTEYRTYAAQAVRVTRTLKFEDVATIDAIARSEDHRACLLNLRAHAIQLHQGVDS